MLAQYYPGRFRSPLLIQFVLRVMKYLIAIKGQ